MAAYSGPFLWLLLLVITGCKSPKPKQNDAPVNRDAGEARVSRIRHNFMDSVDARDKLSLQQIAANTILDSTYRKVESSFAGDTLYRARNKYPVAIIRYNDGKVCSNKFLLVFKANGVNADYTEIETDCDEDNSTNYSRLSFKVLTDTSFYTRELFYKKLPGDSMRTTVTTRHYIINSEGMLEAVKEDVEEKGVTKREE